MTRSPLTLYVAWHPRCAAGDVLARAVYRWFHSPSDDLLRAGLGVPVFFRSQAAPASKVPHGVDLDAAELNALLVLADEHMVSDPAWSAWLHDLAAGPRAVLMVPVALHPSAYRLPEALRRLNFLRVQARGQEANAGAASIQRDVVDAMVAPLLSQLTEVLSRELTARLRATSGAPTGIAPPPMTIFLSHAKRDGVQVATALRDAIQGHSRLRTFFDDSDLPVGHAFSRELEHAALHDSAAMIALVTDAYAARPWCRREVELARRPRPEPGHPQCWANRPLLVVDHLSGNPTRNIAELGNATMARWSEGRAREMVDLLMLEVLLSAYHRLRARGVPVQPGRQVISWSPDAVSLLALQRACDDDVDEVVYPGHALPEAERRALARLFPDLRLVTFEDVAAQQRTSRSAAAGRVVGLSIGFHPQLGALGLGRDHFEEVALRVGRLVVESGGRIAFGGMLGSSGLTESLLTLARAVGDDDDDDDEGDVASAGAATTTPARILSWQRWPSLPGPQQIANDVGIAEYVLVDNPLPPAQRVRPDRRIISPEHVLQDALSLAAMRLAMSRGGAPTSAARPAPAADARVFIGGLSTDFNGFMPGLFEEALYALEAGVAMFVLGGFGGAACLLARALSGEGMPAEFEAAHHLKPDSRFALLQQALHARGGTHARMIDELYQRLRDAVSGCASAPHGLRNGLTVAENQRLMQTDHVAEVIDLLRLGMARLWPATA